MLELLKKIGVPATVAAVIASVVTIAPFMFKIDERYAKAEHVDDSSAKVAKQLADLTVEVSKLAGVQQTMLALMTQADQRIAVAQSQPTTVYVPAPAPAPIRMAAAPKPPEDCEKLTAEGFKCMGAAPAPAPAPVATAPAAPIPIKIAPPVKTPEQLAQDAARKKQFEQVGEQLRRSQVQLQSIQDR